MKQGFWVVSLCSLVVSCAGSDEGIEDQLNDDDTEPSPYEPRITPDTYCNGDLIGQVGLEVDRWFQSGLLDNEEGPDLRTLHDLLRDYDAAHSTYDASLYQYGWHASRNQAFRLTIKPFAKAQWEALFDWEGGDSRLRLRRVDILDNNLRIVRSCIGNSKPSPF